MTTQQQYTSTRGGKKKEPFVQIFHYILEDNRINANAYRILSYLESKPDGWKFWPKDIQTRLNIKRFSYDVAIQQLVDAGYINYVTGNRFTRITFYLDPRENETFKGELPELLKNSRTKNPQAGEQVGLNLDTQQSKTSKPIIADKKQNTKENKKTFNNFKSTVGQFKAIE